MQLINELEAKLAAASNSNEQLMQEKLDAQWQADKRIQAQDQEIARLRAQVQFHTNHASLSDTTATSTGQPEYGDDLQISPLHSTHWADFVSATDYASPQSINGKMEQPTTFAMAERSRPFQHQLTQPEPGAGLLILFLVAAGVSVTAYPSSETLKIITWSDAFRAAQPISNLVVRYLLGDTSVASGQRATSVGPSLDNYSCELLKMLQDGLKPEATQELRNLLRNAGAKGGILSPDATSASLGAGRRR